MVIRDGSAGDVPAVLSMFDSAVAWLVAQGRTGQWGSLPFSTDPARVRQVASWQASGGMRVAEVGGEPAGCLVLGPPPHYVTPAPEPELYVQALVIDQRFRAHGVGSTLLEHARAEAVKRGVPLLRVDCYAGDDGRLVEYYERQGFTRAGFFAVGEWPGQLLELRLPAPPDGDDPS